MMAPGLRKLALTAHVTCSVGWIGAVAGFLALAAAGLTSPSAQIVRAAYLAMEVTGWRVIVPLCFASLVTGIVQALGTPWGLLRHYWVVTKLLIAIAATVLLLVHLQVAVNVARLAGERELAFDEMRSARVQLIVDASAALASLLLATTLSIYKPRGLTRHGWQKQQQARAIPT